MEEKSMTKNYGGEIIGGTIIEKRSLRRNHWKENHREEIIEEGGIWKASGRHLEGIWEAPGGGIWEASGTPGSHGAPGGCKTQKAMSFADRMQKFY